jgi:PKD repeat protein
MNRKRNIFFSKFLFLFVMISLFTSSQAMLYSERADQHILARVEVTGMLNDLKLPVYAHLQDGAGNDYALVIASQAQLDQSGLAYRILDKNAEGADYYILTMLSGNIQLPLTPMAQLAKVNVLLDDGKQIIVRTTSKQAEALVEAGFEIRWLDHTPMVVKAPAQEPISSLSTVNYDSVIAGMINQVSQTTVDTYEKNLSGVNSVLIGGSSYTIATRHTSSGTPISKATQYVYEFMQGKGLTVSYHNWSLSGYSGRNVIGQKTGATTPNEIVLITAHLDDMPSGSTAPGADDNASGSVGVMMSAEILSQQQFARTVRFVFFTGEEQGLLGSAAYSDQVYGSGENIVAVFNMDMISYDAVGLPYLRLHTRTSSSSGYSGDLAIANTFVDVLNAYSLSSVLSPIITSDGESRSDHSSFWDNGYYGILSIEDHINDITPYYHLTTDTYSTLNMTYFTNYVKAIIGTAAHLAIRYDGTPQPPVANFSGNPTTVLVGNSVAFTDLSTNTPTSWAWTFTGGTPGTSTTQNPTVTYSTVGTYTVSLTATNASGSDNETKTAYITVVNSIPDEIAEGLDYTGSTFTKTGNANWAKVTDVYYNGGDSAKSGAITHSQSCSIETSVTVTAAKTVKFYWQVSSEASYDYLRFYIDGVQMNQISGSTTWAQVSNSLAIGTHTLKWTYIKDSSVSSGSDCGWVDKLEIVTPTTDPIAEALDYAGLTFTLTGNANWYSQTTTTYYGGDAAQSGLITHSQSTSMETAISGKTTVKFYWRVSSESGYDYLRFYIDGTLKNSISGSTSWAQKSYTVTTGAHTLKWTYVKDSSVSSGSDCGWVDKLELL